MLSSQVLTSEVTVEKLSLGKTPLFIYVVFWVVGPSYFVFEVSKVWHTHVVAVFVHV